MDALAMMADRQFDLVLLDIIMPEMNGYQVLERLKADGRWREIPVVMISAVHEIESVVRWTSMAAPMIAWEISLIAVCINLDEVGNRRKPKHHGSTWRHGLDYLGLYHQTSETSEGGRHANIPGLYNVSRTKSRGS